MAHIIGLIQVKGGAGRSTVATNLACYLSAHLPTALIDCDMPQGTSASWGAVRSSSDHLWSPTVMTASSHMELVRRANRLSYDHDLLVIDAPPRIEEITRAILMLSSLCLVPLSPSAAEIWATSDLLPTIDEARRARPHTDVRIVWNRYRGETRLAKETSHAVQDVLGLPEMNSKLGHRVAFGEAMARGLSVIEWSDRVAQREIEELAEEILAILGETE